MRRTDSDVGKGRSITTPSRFTTSGAPPVIARMCFCSRAAITLFCRGRDMYLPKLVSPAKNETCCPGCRERLREYRWSSYRGYAGFEKMKSFLDSEPIQGVFESYSGRCWKAREYRRWVEEGLIGEIEDPFEAVKWQQVLGGEGFLRKLKDHWNQRVERPKNYGQKRNWSAVGAEQILERVSEHFQCDLETLKERGVRNNLARRRAITLCWDHAGLSQDEIAALFRMPSSNSVAQTIRRTKAHEAQTLKVLKNQISHK